MPNILDGKRRRIRGGEAYGAHQLLVHKLKTLAWHSKQLFRLA